MSRSFKKVPIVKDHDSGKWGKRQASKAVRRKKEVPIRNKEYKKTYPTWNVHDYTSYYPREKAIQDWYDEENLPEHSRTRHRKYATLEDCLGKDDD